MDPNVPRRTASAAQCRAARALLKWTQKDLAQRARVARKTVADFECGRQLIKRTRREITTTLEDAGIVFLIEPGDGVRLQAASDIRQESATASPLDIG